MSQGLMDNPCCIHCGELETTDHLFLHCPFAAQVWSLAAYASNLDVSTMDFITALKATRNKTCVPPTGITSGQLFPWICWFIWTARNYLAFEGRTFTPKEVNSKATSKAREW